MRRGGRSKYQVDHSPRGRMARTYRGRLYDSRAEMAHAVQLDADPTVDFWLRQVGFDLGEDERYRADFLVRTLAGDVFAVDVKGVETTAFKRVRRLWAKYGPCELHVVRRGRTAEVIDATGCER